MLDTVVLLCLGIITAALLLTFARLIKGPDLPDPIRCISTLSR